MAIDNNNPNPTGFSGVLKACLITTAVFLVLIIALVAYMLRLPSLESISLCTSNMQEVAAAILRYTDVNGHRPSELQALVKNYLPKPSLLRCPLDKSPGNIPSYSYNPRAKDGQVMLECDRHRLWGNTPKSKLRVLGDGSFVIANPGIREAMKEAGKRARRQ